MSHSKTVLHSSTTHSSYTSLYSKTVEFEHQNTKRHFNWNILFPRVTSHMSVYKRFFKYHVILNGNHCAVFNIEDRAFPSLKKRSSARENQHQILLTSPFSFCEPEPFILLLTISLCQNAPQESLWPSVDEERMKEESCQIEGSPPIMEIPEQEILSRTDGHDTDLPIFRDRTEDLWYLQVQSAYPGTEQEPVVPFRFQSLRTNPWDLRSSVNFVGAHNPEADKWEDWTWTKRVVNCSRWRKKL
jgi:hypothetical protein